MKNLIAEITKQITNIQGCQFASLTYLSKGTKELARHTINLGFNYHTLVLKSITELEILISESTATWTELQKTAAANVMASLQKTVEAHARGEQNEDYTKKDQYIPIANGVNVNTTDNTIQLFGLAHTKTVLVAGEYKKVNSKPLTIAQNEIRKQLSISKFREFALDLTQVDSARVNGNTLELVPAAQ
jgi:hypothetical protein